MWVWMDVTSPDIELRCYVAKRKKLSGHITQLSNVRIQCVMNSFRAKQQPLEAQTFITGPHKNNLRLRRSTNVKICELSRVCGVDI